MTKTLLPTLDVVVPYYNEEGELEECVARLVADQDIQSIILVDNNSTDTSPAIAKDFARQDTRITLVQEARRGVKFARDTGISRSSADIVARIDADTRIQPGWAGKLRQYYAKNPDVAAASGAYEFYDLPFRRFTNLIVWLFLVESNYVIAGNYGLYGANMSIRRDVWMTIYDDLRTEDGIMEDMSIALALDKYDYKVGYVREALAHVSGRRMRTHPRSFKQYNDQWWRTYQAYGYRTKARTARLIATVGSLGHRVAYLLLRFHDAESGKFRISNFKKTQDDRVIP